MAKTDQAPISPAAPRIGRLARSEAKRAAKRASAKRRAGETTRMRDHAHTLSDFRVPTLSIESEPCGRHDVAKLIEQYGDAPLPELLHQLADCPKARSVSVHDRCKAVYGRDSRWSTGTLRRADLVARIASHCVLLDPIKNACTIDHGVVRAGYPQNLVMVAIEVARMEQSGFPAVEKSGRSIRGR